MNVSYSPVFCTFDKKRYEYFFLSIVIQLQCSLPEMLMVIIYIFLITELPASGLPSGNEMHYLSREEDRSGHPMAKDTKTIGSAYDRYLQGVTLHPFMLV